MEEQESTRSTRSPILVGADESWKEAGRSHQQGTREEPLPIPHVSESHQTVGEVLNDRELLQQQFRPQFPDLLIAIGWFPALDSRLDQRADLSQLPNLQSDAAKVADELRPSADLLKPPRKLRGYEACLGEPDELLHEVVDALPAVCDSSEEAIGGVEGATGGGAEGVEILDELAKAEGLAAKANAGFEGLKAGSEGWGYGGRRGG